MVSLWFENKSSLCENNKGIHEVWFSIAMQEQAQGKTQAQELHVKWKWTKTQVHAHNAETKIH